MKRTGYLYPTLFSLWFFLLTLCFASSAELRPTPAKKNVAQWAAMAPIQVVENSPITAPELKCEAESVCLEAISEMKLRTSSRVSIE